MAENHNQRPYRANEAPSSAGGSGSDPLAELARLIGQNDPFSEFGQSGRRAAAQQAAPQEPAPQPAAPPINWPRATPPRQQFGSAPLAAGLGVYEVEGQVGRQAHNATGYEAPGYEVPGYGAPGYQASGFPAAPEEAAYGQQPFPSSHHDGDAGDYYEEEAPPSRRRFGVLAVAAIFGLAVIGTAGAFGYRAIFGSSSISGPPPVIKAETTPSKIVPATIGKDAQGAKMITDRANDRGIGEKLVSREEQPIAVTPERPTESAFPQAANAAPFAQPPQPGSGVLGAEPKKIRTISIRPDGSAEPSSTAATPAPAENQNAPPPHVVNITPARQSQASAAPQPEATPEPTHSAPPARTAAVPRQPEAAPANAPLSLDPNGSSAPSRSAPQRTAVASPPARIAPAASSGGSGGYAVQVSARKSEEDAQAALRQIQAKYPSQLGGRPSMIKRVDLGAKGIYFRAMVGPFGSSSEASSLCTSLKSAGGQCMVQKN